jgi:hypothetical protein
MGLNFKILVIWKALSTMPPKVAISAAGVKPGAFGSTGSKDAAAQPARPKDAPAPAPKAAPAAPLTCTHGANCWGCSGCGKTPPKKGKSGKDDGGADVAGLRKEIGELRTLVKQGFQKQAEQASEISAKVESGFKKTQSILSEQQQATIEMQKAMQAMMMASATFQSSFTGLLKGGMASRPELPAPLMRPAICAPATTPSSSVTEVHEERSSARSGGFANEVGGELHSYMHSCFNTNEVGISSISSSQRSQSGAACGGGSSSDSSRFAINKEPQTEFRSSSGGSALVAARQLGVSQHLPKFEQNLLKIQQNEFNQHIGAAIRNFVASFPPSQQDEMACVLLGMVNGKKYPAHNHIIMQSNDSVFRRFFGELATKFPSNAVKITNNLGEKCSFPYKTVSIDQSAMWSLIRVLRGEE